MKYIIRKFSLWLEGKTRRWVVPSSTWAQLDSGDTLAKIGISDAAVKWGTCDPEVVRAGLYLRRIQYKEQQ